MWQHQLTAADATKKSEARSSFLRFSPASVKKKDAEKLKTVRQFQASAAQITVNSSLVQSHLFTFLLYLETHFKIKKCTE